MADNNLENVRIMVQGNQYSVSQLGIDLIQQSRPSVGDDPVVEAVIVSRRKSGLLEVETSLQGTDTLAKFAEHLTLISNFESATENAERLWEDPDD